MHLHVTQFLTLMPLNIHPCLILQLPLVIVDSSLSGKMSTITSNSTITGEIDAKIDNRSAQSVHYNEKFHYYEIHYYERRLYLVDIPFMFMKFFLNSNTVASRNSGPRNSGISRYSGQIFRTDCLF